MNTIERVLNLLKEQGIAVSRLEKDLGFSNGYIRSLKKGTLPNDRLISVAEYLGVPAAYLAKGTEGTQSVFVVTDRSMAPLFNKKDVITYEEGSSICNEGLAIIRVADRVLFRKVKTVEKGLVLMPLNPTYSTDFYTYKDLQELPVKILGQAKHMERRL